jgi:putative DNA primase/helicase
VSIDVNELKARNDIVSVVGSYIALKKRGAEYVALCPFHDDKSPSLWVSPAKQFCHCFACDASHDVISFVQEMEGIDFLQACEKLGAEKKWEPKAQLQRPPPKPERITSRPPPDAPQPDFTLRALGEPELVFPIKDLDGALLGYECRYKGEKGKEIRVWTWGSRDVRDEPGWACGHFNVPRPLYGLPRLLERPDAPVSVFEGPKKAEAGKRLLPAYACLSWTGGAQAWHRHDWAPLAGRKILIWPDADEPGWTAAEKLAALLADPRGLACSVRIVDTHGQPEGWDIADAEADGWDTMQLVEWAKPRARDYMVPQTIQENQLDNQSVPEPPQDDEPPFEGSDSPLPVAMSEDALADAFAKEHKQDWRFVKDWGRGQWMHWEGSVWRRDQKELIDRLAVEMCRRACTWAEAQQLTAKDRRYISRRTTAGNVRDIARNDRRIAASPEIWDADPLLVGIPGGVFDVRSGKVIKGDREQYITRCTSVAPAPGVPKRWLEHMRRMMAGDEALINFLHTFAGYCATGDASEQCFLFLYGMGQTGKGTFLLTIGELLGSYSAYASASTFMSTDREKHTSELARLSGCRFVVIDETDGTARWNEERLKRQTGGGKITAARKYHDEEDIPVTWKLAFAGNHKPALRGVGKEMERRIRLVKCNASIPDDAVDKRFRERMIAEEGPQILNWILEGAMAWRDGGLPLPEQITDATRDYLQSEDTIGDWIEECCEQKGYIARPAAYKAFSSWQERRGERSWGNRAWWSAMEDRGYSAKKSNGIWHIGGLSLAAQSEGYDVP